MDAVMDETSVLRIVAEAIEEVAGVSRSQVLPEKVLIDDLDIDSLSMVEIAFMLQKEVGKEIPDEKLADIKTVRDLMRLLSSENNA